MSFLYAYFIPATWRFSEETSGVSKCEQFFRKSFGMKNGKASVPDIPEFPEHSLRYVLLYIQDILFPCLFSFSVYQYSIFRQAILTGFGME